MADRSAAPRTRTALRALALACGLALSACAGEPDASSRPAGTPSQPAARPVVETLGEVIEVVYDGALGKGWNDYGWTTREIGKGAARLDMASYGGWIIARPGLTGRFGNLVLRMSSPAAYGDFLEVRLASERADLFPHILVSAQHRRPLPDGWTQIALSVRELNPDGLPFDRIWLRAAKPIGSERVLIDKIGFTAPDPNERVPEVPADDVALAIDCSSAGVAVSPMIFGIAYDSRLDGKDRHQFALGATARRWGGNATSRFNWELGNAWSTAQDWYFENTNFTGIPTYSYADFLKADLERGMSTALTVPILGWVAKDTTSYGFPVSVYGAQRSTDPYKPDAGDGHGKDGKPIAPGAPTRTSVASPPESIRRWIEKIVADDAARGKRSVQMYILDNEPMLWNSTHRDVHPEPVTYDELLDRTIRYGSAVRAADPSGVIAGPASWGWPAYFFSAKDAAEGFAKRPDRLAHGDVPLLAWYLQKLRAHEQKTGTRLLDVLDVHFYPQGQNVWNGGGATDRQTAALRLRSTRALWDPTYVDESWIGEAVQLIPRMQKLIADNYPGLGFSIGEYNFGAEQHISGGLALAEALGRFAQGGVTSAFYWTYPPDRSPAFWAFRAYRNFDGAGGHFLDRSLPTTMADGVSLFASRDAAGTHVVAVLLNLRPARAIRPRVTLTGCGAAASSKAFRYAGGPDGFTATSATGAGAAVATEALPPSSITVLDLRLEAKP